MHSRGPWVAIQRNPKSGEGAKREQILALCSQLRQLGIRPRLFSNRERLGERLTQAGEPAHRSALWPPAAMVRWPISSTASQASH